MGIRELARSLEDPTCRFLDAQYMLGEALLVASVFREDGEVEVWLPAGRWTHLLTGEEVEGGCWRRERHGFSSLPLYVREGTLLALGRGEERPDYDHADGVELQLFALADGRRARAVVRDLQGRAALAAAVERRGRWLSVSLQGNARGCRLLLRGVTALPPRPQGVEVTATGRGVQVSIPAGQEALVLEV